MIYIFGHKNPDTDSVTSAIALSDLKNQLGYDTRPCVLGNVNKETKFILEYFNQEEPKIIDNVKTQIKDLNYDVVEAISPDKTILYAYKYMEEKRIRILPIVEDDGKLLGIVTMKDIAMGLIKGDFYHLKTGLKNIKKDFNGKILAEGDNDIEGKISVIAYYHDTIRERKLLNEDSIVIVGDRYDIIDYAIECKVKLMIITGGRNLPQKYLQRAKDANINVLSVEQDTYTVSKLINQCNYVSSIMKSKDIIKFNEKEYLDDVKEPLTTNKYSNYPVVTDDNKYRGFINRRHILNPNKKEVILVDHNEYSQSAEGLEQSDILEIVDHHKIGDISTVTPINFRNIPVGSTCTIVFNMFKENNIKLEEKMAGILMSGIISDTLYLKSPTTTELDRIAVEELNRTVKIELEEYAMEMFRAGTSLEGQSIDEIFFKDFKEFNIKGNKVGIGQVFTLDIEDVFNRKKEFIDYINSVHGSKGCFLTLLLITDIIKEGSFLLYKANNNSIIPTAFDKPASQGMFVDTIVSRKKQVVPKILKAIDIVG